MKNDINLEKFAGGALAEKFNVGLKEVLENIADPNTDPVKKRKMTVELEFKSDEDRELSMVNIIVKTKLVPKIGVATKIIIDKDGKGGIVASEYQNQVKGQRYMRVNEETGEILKDDEAVDIEGIKIIK
ncbi:replication terminator protein [Senegalia massiliensis]|uniref:replication terminator protein n=1 Tax=Senegalia massiliensis TaxID=1720316 RepID=UPI001030D124|nr:replication terminator protein [Senegalia massiliensis]